MVLFKSFIYIFKIALSIIAGVVGIGFVSGKEIVSFFFKYEPISLFLICLVCILFFVILYLKLSKNSVKLLNITNNKPQISLNIIEKTHKNNTFNKYYIFSIILCILCLFSTSTMVAGLRLLLFSVFCNKFISLFITLIVLCFVYNIISKNVNFLIKFSSFFMFILIIFMTVNTIYGFNLNLENNSVIYNEGVLNFNIVFSGIMSVIFYVSMNTLSISGLVNEISSNLSNKKQALLISFLSSLFLFFLLFIVILLFRLHTNLIMFTMPLLELSKNVGGWFYYLYLSMLVFGSIISVINISFSGTRYIKRICNKRFKLFCFLFLLLSFVLSFVGFDFLVEKIYPLIGMVYLVVNIVSFCFIYKNNNN